MQRSPSTSSSEAPRTRRRAWSSDTQAVSEVIGYTITFGILSIVLVVALNGFNETQQDAEERVVALRAQSAAQRVAGTIVEVALLAEDNNGGSGLEVYEREILLPNDFEGHDYFVSFDTSNVTVEIPALGLNHTEPLFGALQAGGITACSPAKVSGGPLRIVFNNSDTPPLCIEEVS